MAEEWGFCGGVQKWGGGPFPMVEAGQINSQEKKLLNNMTIDKWGATTLVSRPWEPREKISIEKESISKTKKYRKRNLYLKNWRPAEPRGEGRA